jgi:hypothetical protein
MSFHVYPYQQDKWDFSEIMPKITNPCKHHGIYPVPESLIGGEHAGAILFQLKVHCPKPDCEFYRSEFDIKEWNDRSPVPFAGSIETGFLEDL